MKQMSLLRVVAVIGIAVAMLFPVLSEADAATQFIDSGISLAGTLYSSVKWGDYDNDGDLDLAICGQHKSKIYKNNADGTFIDIGTILPETATFGSFAWGDYDNDGDLDFAINGADFTRIYRNDGADIFMDIGVQLPPVRWSNSIAWGDCDNEGDLDLALSGGKGSGCFVKIYRNNADDTFTDIEAEITGITYAALAWGDYDNDGNLDLAVGGSIGGYVSSERVTRIYKNNGDDTFTDIEAGLTGTSQGSLAWGDYDNDGNLDLVINGGLNVAGGWTNITKIYKNNSDETFTDIEAEVEDVQVGSLAWGDYDNDGDLDLAVCGDGYFSPGAQGYVTKVYRNNGDDIFTDIGAELQAVSMGALAWGDYDNDGDLDLVVSGYIVGNSVTKIYKNIEADYDGNNKLNIIPLAHENLTYEEDGDDVVLKWDSGYDEETTDNGLYYNLRVGTTSGGNDVVSGVYGSPLLGNYLRPKLDSNQLGVILTNLPNGVYFWSVQTIDTGLQASQWSEESFMIIFEPLEANLKILPQVINRNDHNEWGRIMAWMQMPAGITKDQIDENTTLKMYPGGIEAIMQHVIQYGGRGKQQTRIYAFFSKDELLDAVSEDGSVELTVVGKLKTGQCFYGIDTVNIKSPNNGRGSSKNKR
jgi:hypothetical protein